MMTLMSNNYKIELRVLIQKRKKLKITIRENKLTKKYIPWEWNK